MKLDVQATSNLPEWTAALQRYIAVFRVERRKALRTQGRLLAQRLVSFTPPRNQSQGKKAVERDIRRAFMGLENSEEAVWQTFGGDQVIRLFSTKAGVIYGADRAKFRPGADLAEMVAHHDKLRDKRGRVTRAGTYTRDVGRWRFIEKLVVREADLREYIKRKQANVGQARAGWGVAWAALGGKPPAWVARHQRTGAFEDTLDDGDDGYLRMENRSRWATRGDDERVMSNALKAKARDMLSQVAHAEQEAQRKAFAYGKRLAGALVEK